jgi:hypothetical protein
MITSALPRTETERWREECTVSRPARSYRWVLGRLGMTAGMGLNFATNFIAPLGCFLPGFLFWKEFNRVWQIVTDFHTIVSDVGQHGVTRRTRWPTMLLAVFLPTGNSSPVSNLTRMTIPSRGLKCHPTPPRSTPSLANIISARVRQNKRGIRVSTIAALFSGSNACRCSVFRFSVSC